MSERASDPLPLTDEVSVAVAMAEAASHYRRMRAAHCDARDPHGNYDPDHAYAHGLAAALLDRARSAEMNDPEPRTLPEDRQKGAPS